jgi:MFS family permease
MTRTIAPRWAALHYRDFRLLWFGQFVSIVGSQMQFTAVNWHVYELLRGQTITFNLFGESVVLDAGALGLGLIGLARVAPIAFFALIGGAVADARDRRKVMMGAQIAAATFAGTLALLTLAGNTNVVWIYLFTALIAAAAAFENPARQSLIPNLVPREHLTNAISLNTFMMQLASIAGPALAGLAIAQFNAGLVYALNSLSFLVVFAALGLMRYRGVSAGRSEGIGIRPIVEGLRFVFSSRIISSTMLLDFFATFFSSARTMLPVVASELLRTDAAGYGLLSTAQAVGAVVAGGILSLRRDITRQGMVLLASVMLYGLATALFGVTTNFALSYLLFAITGAADTVSTVIRGTIRQLNTPDHLRGRMVGVNMIFFMGGPQLGELEAGLVASAFGVSFAIVSGGIATMLLVGWIAWKYDDLREYRLKLSG